MATPSVNHFKTYRKERKRFNFNNNLLLNVFCWMFDVIIGKINVVMSYHELSKRTKKNLVSFIHQHRQNHIPKQRHYRG